MNKPLNWLQTLLATSVGSVLLILAIVGLSTVFKVASQGATYTEIPSGQNNGIYDLPPDMCYSIIDQTPLVNYVAGSDGVWYVSYTNTSGDLITLVYNYDAFNSHYWLSHKYTGKAAIQPKCYQLPDGTKAK